MVKTSRIGQKWVNNLITDCDKTFKLFKSYQLHLKITYMIDIMDDTLHFNTVEGNNNL